MSSGSNPSPRTPGADCMHPHLQLEPVSSKPSPKTELGSTYIPDQMEIAMASEPKASSITPRADCMHSLVQLEAISSKPSPKAGPETTYNPDEVETTLGPEPKASSITPELGSVTSSSYASEDQDVQTPAHDIDLLKQKLVVLARNIEKYGARGVVCTQETEKTTHTDVSLTGSTSSKTCADHSDLTSTSASRELRKDNKRKRSGSYSSRDAEAESGDLETGTNSSTENARSADSLAPLSKKLKESSFSYLTKQTASSRRAQSLSARSSFASAQPLVPTVPSSPTKARSKVPAVPIVAPPEYCYIPSAPLTPDDAAEVRLKIILEREMAQRRQEGFENGINACFEDITQEQFDEFLGLEEEFRSKVIRWMLTVTPSKKHNTAQLRSQLRKSPETRFHAILLFTRYVRRIGESMPVAGKNETPLIKRGRLRIIWDVAMSCLALAVKFHRDFLNPLSPIYSRDFLVVAPHPMSHDDFEVSQIDVLKALDYKVFEATPDQFIDELWNCLPTLRKVLAFPDGWTTAQTNTWLRLNTAVVEGEMLQYPISLLSASALIEGGIEALVAFYESDIELTEGRDLDEEEIVSLENKAHIAFAGVIEDIKDLMGISKADLKNCREWLQAVLTSDSKTV